MEIVNRLTSSAMLTGAIKWNRTPGGLDLHRKHLRGLDRIADAGDRGAYEALEEGSKLLYVAAGGFERGFAEQASADGLPVATWSLLDLFLDHR